PAMSRDRVACDQCHNHGSRTVDPLKREILARHDSHGKLHNHGSRTVDPLKHLAPVGHVQTQNHNHGSRTVDPLKPGSTAVTKWGFGFHNHGSRTVDPLKPGIIWLRKPESVSITTVLGPWTH